ncbi:hypothetical protein AX769_08940 [Frondihabitans sp. PAMC 28766]|uniref:WXG100 family type VII secretion target n=1 Tax=Frondihabitans sp. PAMC 28766 TaxID=1795630 RepID=UPI00078C80A0|nr:WXG100 family type VII secretion target [Frondihabitans sp. PAMC 28766]AMM20265.1 hypothetical protein AX769_08940 [Frondihabitans sp. PAMC 28766]
MTRHRAVGSSLDALVVELGRMAEYSNALLTGVDSAAATVSTEWSGDAQRQFAALHQEWAAGAARMAEAMADITRVAAAAGTAYDTAAEHNRAGWA